MAESTTKIGQFEYAIGKMNAMTQFHVARRLAPVLAGIAGSLKNAVTEGKGEDNVLDIAFPSFADIVSKMSDAESEYIINKCLSVCKRRTETHTWAAVTAPNGQLMFQDIELEDMMALTLAVIKENLGRFFPTEEQPSPAVKAG